LRLLPDLAARVLAGAGILEGIVRRRLTRPEAFFIGRGLDAAVAYEGALKMKEISYINAQAYAAGELKHGTLALIEPGIPVIALATQNSLFPKMQSNIQEVRARGGIIIAVVQEDLAEGEAGPEIATSKNGGKAGQNTGMEIAAEEIIRIPRVPEILAPVLSTIPLQLLAYYAAVARGCDVDHPRNLAKSVTVE
ncbi:MAG: SIS domain-containing protein, partial [Firmicutes bacterium]|nr:SIS domain-containing protein [Bacillota bacterium]